MVIASQTMGSPARHVRASPHLRFTTDVLSARRELSRPTVVLSTRLFSMDLWNLISALVLVAFFFGVLFFARSLARLERTVDRMEQAAQIVAIDLTATAVDLARASKQRIEQGQVLTRMEAATHVVADNLADSVSRADATNGPEGAAADAALRTGDSAAKIIARQDDARE